MTGLVYKSTGSWYTVKSTEGDFMECRIKGKFRMKGIKSTNPIAVGDIVDYDLDENSDVVTGTITNIHDRKNYIVRKSVNLSHQMHIIASNLTSNFLCSLFAILYLSLSVTPSLPLLYSTFSCW